MRNIVRVLVAVTSVLTVFPVSDALADSARSGEGTAELDSAFVRHLLFETSMHDFVSAVASAVGPDGTPGDDWFDWTADLCSAPLIGSTGRSFDFSDPCRRHDFGYRNAKLLDDRYHGHFWSSEMRKQVDKQFLRDMKHHCHSRRLLDRPTCYSWAYTFYSAVRVAGGP